MLPTILLSLLAGAQSEPVADISQPARIQSGYISDRDYPRAALAAREQGDVRIRYRVTERGRVEACMIEQSSGSTALDQQSCAIWVQRLRFRPARDAAGRAVPQVRTQLFAWRIDTPCGNREPSDICITRTR